jgi:putative transposase
MKLYKLHRFPPDIISYAAWLYYRFNLRHRDIEDLLAAAWHRRQQGINPPLVYKVRGDLHP